MASFLKRKIIPQYVGMINKISQEIELSSVNTWTGLNNFTGGLQKNGVTVPNNDEAALLEEINIFTAANDFQGGLTKSGNVVPSVATNNVWTGTNNFTGGLSKGGVNVPTDATAGLIGSANTWIAANNFTGGLQKGGVDVPTNNTAGLLAGANTWTNTNNFTGGLSKGGVNVPTDATAALLAGANVFTNSNTFNNAPSAPFYNATATSNQFVAGGSNKATLDLPQGASSAYTIHAPDPTASINSVNLMYIDGPAQTIVKNVTMNTGASLTHSGNLRFDNVSGFLTQISVDSASVAYNFIDRKSTRLNSSH